MYIEHQSVASAWAREKPEHFARVVQFCVASARTRFESVLHTMRHADSAGPFAAMPLARARGWDHAWRRRDEVFHNCEEIASRSRSRRERGEYLVRYLAMLPGLGLVKAGFIAQIAYGAAGCLDTINCERLDLPPWFNGNSRYRMKMQLTP